MKLHETLKHEFPHKNLRYTENTDWEMIGKA